MFVVEQKLRYRSKNAGEMLPPLQDWTEIGHADRERAAFDKVFELRPNVSIKWEGVYGERYTCIENPTEQGILFEYYRVREVT